jgi:alpha-D-ribose 1-methylphosphonate 5-triphosphate synthase subunit PhnH
MAEIQKRVQYIQQLYRKLIKCYSHPGSVEEFPTDDKHDFEFDSALGRPLLSIALLLLDREVTHEIMGAPADERNTLVELTYSRRTGNDADYIFICRNTAAEEAGQCIHDAKTGSLIDPQKAATVVFETDDLYSGECVTLCGPGIKDTEVLKSTCPAWFWNLRREKNRDFPLGIDIILLDAKGRIAALPRTTKMAGEHS